MTPRKAPPPPPESSNPTSPVGLPLHAPATQDHNFSVQAIFSIHGKVEGLDRAFGELSGRIDRMENGVTDRLAAVENELKTVASDVRTAKIIFGIAGTVLTLVTGFLATAAFKILDLAVTHWKAPGVPGH